MEDKKKFGGAKMGQPQKFVKSSFEIYSNRLALSPHISLHCEVGAWMMIT